MPRSLDRQERQLVRAARVLSNPATRLHTSRLHRSRRAVENMRIGVLPGAPSLGDGCAKAVNAALVRHVAAAWVDVT